VPEPHNLTTFLFTDIEGSTRLWEQDGARMGPAMALHDAMARAAVQARRGRVVKMTGDGVHAAFDDALDALGAALALQRSLADPGATAGLALRVRCGLHAGTDERRDNDFYGTAVNRAARIMAAAHGGQVLVSDAVARLVSSRLPEGVALRDLGAVRLRDLAQPERVHQVMHPDLRAEFPALRSLEKTPNNLPRALTSFVGRERELHEVRARLGTARLLTVTGMGGLGKSRLAIEAAWASMDGFADGAWLAELAPLRDPSRVAQAIASALGVKEEAGHPVIEALERHVADRELLIVLDNCEHLLAACAEVARRLLGAGARLTILATSREPLRLGGESTYPLAALAVPSPFAAGEPSALEQYDAVRLFIDRAAAAQAAFALDAENAGAVTAICHRLDGVPLALELAAARVRTMPVEQIALRLNDRFRLLTRGDPTALPRQQTLRATIDWSHDLLDAAERAVFHRLSVFAGGWSLDAAEAVASGAGVVREDVADLLGRLVEKSLAEAHVDSGRYRLLETVRQYAEEKLADSPDGPAARSRHLACFAGLAEQAKRELVGADQARWIERLDVERENLLRAHEYAGQSASGTELGLNLVNAVKRYWINSGLLELGLRVTLEALARPGAQERGFPRLRGLFDAGQLGFFVGRYEQARACLEESLSIAREMHDEGKVAMVLTPLAWAARAQGDLPTARACLQEALALAEKLGDRREILAATNALAQIHRMEGDLRGAETLYRRVIPWARQGGDREATAIGLLNLAIVAIALEAPHDAGAALKEACALADDIGSRRVGHGVLEVAAALATSLEQWEQAARLLGGAEAHGSRAGLHRDPADEAFLAPRIAGARARLGAAAFEARVAEGRSLSYDDAMAQARSLLATCR
jgi:predicted ATPase/class 3 adenylate cyclase